MPELNTNSMFKYYLLCHVSYCSAVFRNLKRTCTSYSVIISNGTGDFSCFMFSCPLAEGTERTD